MAPTLVQVSSTRGDGAPRRILIVGIVGGRERMWVRVTRPGPRTRSIRTRVSKSSRMAFEMRAGRAAAPSRDSNRARVRGAACRAASGDAEPSLMIMCRAYYL